MVIQKPHNNIKDDTNASVGLLKIKKYWKSKNILLFCKEKTKTITEKMTDTYENYKRIWNDTTNLGKKFKSREIENFHKNGKWFYKASRNSYGQQAEIKRLSRN